VAVSAQWRVLQNAAAVGVLTALVKILAAAKVVVTARYFGASDALDAFLIAFLLPNFLVETVAGTVTQSLVPALIRKPGDAATRLTRAALSGMLALMTCSAVLLAAASRWILPWLGASFPPEKLALTRSLMLGMLVWLPLGACSAVWRGVLHANNRVALAAAVQMGTPVITMLLLAGAAQMGVWVLSLAVVMGAAFEFAILGFAARRSGYPVWPGRPAWTPEWAGHQAIYLPLLAGAAIASGCGLVDQAAAAALGSGSVAALTYGVKFTTVLVAVGGMAMSAAVLPEFSRLVAQRRWAALRHALLVHAGAMLLLLVPLTAALIWWSPELVRLLYQRGEFGPEEASVVASIQRYSLLQAPLAVMLVILQRLATALGAAALVVHASLAAMVVNLVGDFSLPRWMGVEGIPVASLAGQAVFLVVLAKRLIGAQPCLLRRP
jgi:putative peptidoglycan lipid II flippase